MNKGKQEVHIFDDVKLIYYTCKRCGVSVPAHSWSGDTHKKCDKYFKTKAIREKAEGIAISKIYLHKAKHPYNRKRQLKFVAYTQSSNV